MSKHLPGFRHLAGHLSAASQQQIITAIRSVIKTSPLYRPTMPRSGKPLSVLMTNCGPMGWVSSKDGGYRYQTNHPENDKPWPPIPEPILALWRELSAYPVDPEACLINWYEPGAKLGLHVDADEAATCAPVISISLGDDAWFRIGGLNRRDGTDRILLQSGDVVVLGGRSRLAYHGIDRIAAQTSDLLGQPGRFNLTMRRVTLPAD